MAARSDLVPSRPEPRAIRKVLVANRGEIAIRVCRTLREMGLASVTVYSEPDRGAPHARAGDESYLLGPADPARSYLHIAGILDVARRAGADAIHPGYGFLAERAEFARACADAGVAFLGPSPESMERLGNKAAARRAAVRLGIPVVPGEEDVDSVEKATEAARRIGYPVLLKAAGGGGGRGMRRVEEPAALGPALESARREAKAAFGDPRVFLEKCVHPARHVEIQILGDGRDAVALGERECSLQRRYQKVLEESPSTALGASARAAMEAAATALARDAGYSGAATVEFLLGPDGSFYFLEVNTRLQVEHPVTEMRFGLDLVRAQIEIASGGPLPRPGAARGHAIEARLNAEDPHHGYLPQSGKLLLLEWPHGEGVRVDAGVAEGQSLHTHYDSLLAKVIAHGRDRGEARARLLAALRSLGLLGVMTNQGFLIDILEDPAFARGETFTHTLESREWPGPAAVPDEALLAASIAIAAPRGRRDGERDDADRFSPWRSLGGWGRPAPAAAPEARA